MAVNWNGALFPAGQLWSGEQQAGRIHMWLKLLG